jgi:hypothetical protein
VKLIIFLLVCLLVVLVFHVIHHVKVYIVYSANIGSIFMIGLVIFLAVLLYLKA